MTAPIIVAGPDTAGRQALAEILRENQHTVALCQPERVLEEIQAQAAGLLILLEEAEEVHHLIRQVRIQPDTQDLPIIVALSEFSDAAAAWALEVGADDFLVAPFQAREVIARVAVALRLRQDRRLLLSSRDDFARTFRETHHPVFICDRSGASCNLNPSLRRFLGYPGKGDAPLPVSIDDMVCRPEDGARFRELLSQASEVSHLKLNLKDKNGQPVTVLVNDVSLPARPQDRRSFQVQPVGSPSPLRKALQGLVDHVLPGARDYLALLQLTPLLGGKYEKIKKLGQGAFGEVWLVVDTETTGPDRQYVAKIPLLKAANTKFRKEAAICKKLSPHPGVANLVEVLEDDGKVVLIQEYVAGETLGEKLGEELPRPLVERIVLQLIEVVAHAHQNRIMHRDIKPNNIIITPEGVLKLLDFGVAKILGEKDISATMVGSRPFMAPEQIMGKSERRSDIWAIGVLMYLLYSGELPFYSEVEKLLIDQILEQEPAPPREHNPEIPEALEHIILKCLNKKVEERYPQAIALKADLLKHFPHYGTQTGRWPWIQ
jgi:CheY-like chemotaxis protein